MSIIQIDFGTSVTTSEDGWNNCLSASIGTDKTGGMIDGTGAAVGVTREFEQTWSRFSNSTAGPVHGWPASATNDAFTNTSGAARKNEFVFPADHYGITHQMTIWGSTSSGTDQIGSFEVFNSSLVSLAPSQNFNAKDNGAADPIVITYIVPSNGIVRLDAAAVSGSARISVLTIAYSLGGIALIKDLTNDLTFDLTSDLTG